MNDVESRKKNAHKAMCQISTDENKRRYRSLKKKWRNGMFMPAKGLKTGSKEVEGGRCMRGSDEKQCFSEKERSKV